MNKKEQCIIVGPCALESADQARITIEQAKICGITHVRTNPFKPRTRPGFEGIGWNGLSIIRETAQAGLVPSMEVLLPEQVDRLMEEILLEIPHATLLLWIGSRNQNHMIQRELGKAIAGESRVQLMIKNQPWRDRDHWEGIVEHVLSGGARLEQLLLCHRGFAPWNKNDSPTRNIEDLEMAQKVRDNLKIPMILDPSHIGGDRKIVKMLIAKYAQLPWVDGQIIEVHPNPNQAKTDAKQQLTWEELRALSIVQTEIAYA